MVILCNNENGGALDDALDDNEDEYEDEDEDDDDDDDDDDHYRGWERTLRRFMWILHPFHSSFLPIQLGPFTPQVVLERAWTFK